MSRDGNRNMYWQGAALSCKRRLQQLLSLVVLASLLLVGLPAASVFAKGGDPVSPFAVIDARTGLQYAKAMAVDSIGNIIVAGYNNSGTSNDYQVAKFKADGSGLAWPPVSYGGSSADIATAVVIDSSDNIIVSGTVWNSGSYDIHTIKYNGATGAVIWQDTYDAAAGDDTATAIAVDTSGDIYVAGYAINGIHNDDFLIIKYPSAGATPAWVELYDDTDAPANINRIQAITAGSDGIAVTGYSSNGADFDILTRKYGFDKTLVRQWRYSSAGSRDDRGVGVKMDTAGNVIVTGFISNAANNTDIYTVKYAPGSDTPLWGNIYDGNGADEPKGLWVDSGGDVYVSGYIATLAGNQDFFTVRYSSAGAEVWKSILDAGNGSTDIPVGIVVAEGAAGGVFISGYSTVAGSEDFLTVKYRKDNGTLLWEKRWDGPGNKNDRPVGIALEPSGGAHPGNVIVAGWSDSVANGYDFAAIKYDFGALDAPSALTAKAASDTSITLSWADNSANENSFIIQRKKISTPPEEFADLITVPATLPADTVTYTDSGLAANSYYYYRVRASNAANGDSSYSNEAHALTKVVSYTAPGWSYLYNGAENLNDLATAITTDSDNHPVVTGYSDLMEEGLFDPEFHSYDFMTFKLDRVDKSVKWKSRYDSGDGGTDMAAGLALDSPGNLLVTGTAYLAGGGDKSDELYTRKVATAGLNDPEATPGFLWDHQYGTLDGIDMATAIAMIRDGSNNSVVIGHGGNAAGNDDIFIIKYNNDGTIPWAPIVYNSGRHDIPSGVAFDAAGNIFVTGYSFDTTEDPTGSYDWFTAKYDGASGALIWSDSYNVSSVKFGGNRNDLALSIDVDKAGNAYVTGYATNSEVNTVFYTVKYDGAALPAGNRRVWEKEFNYAGFDSDASTVKIDPIDGGVVIAGTAYVSATDSDFHLIKYNPADGTLVSSDEKLKVWDRNFDRPGSYDYLTTMTMDSSGYIYLTGNSRSGLDTDPDSDTSSDLLSLIYDYEGTFLGAMNFDGTGRKDEVSAITANYRGESFIAGFTTNAANNKDYVVLKQVNSYPLVPGPFTATTQADYSKIDLAWQQVPVNGGGSATATVAAGAVTAIAVTSGGSGYVTAPAVILTGGGGSGATATATVLNGAIATINVTSGGSAYTTPPAVSFSSIVPSFKVFRTTGPSNPLSEWTLVASPAAGQVAYTDAAVPLPGVNYCYTIEAISGSLNSRKTEACVTTRLSQPTLLTLTVDSTSQITLNWEQIAGNTGYQVERKIGAGLWVALPDKGAGQNFHIDSGLTPGTSYSYRVSTKSAAGYSLPCSEQNAITKPIAPLLNVPASISNKSMYLAWSSVTGAATYTLEYKDGVGGSWEPSGCPVNANLNCQVVLPVSDPPTPPNHIYYFRVKATTSTFLDSGWSDPTSATAALAAPTWATTPATPSEITNTSMTLTWVNPSVTGAGPITYVLQYRIPPALYVDETTPSACTGNTGTSCTVAGLTAGTTYAFRVKAVNSHGSSAWVSAEKTAVPVLAMPVWSVAPNPSNIKADEMTVSWGAVYGATGYTLEITPFGSSSYTKDCGANLTCTASGLAANKSHSFRVQASNAAGLSIWSGILSGLTKIIKPVLSSPLATTASTTAIDLTWTASPGATEYSIEQSDCKNSGTDPSTCDGTTEANYNAWAVKATVGAVTTTNITGLTGGVDYRYRITAKTTVPVNASDVSNVTHGWTNIVAPTLTVSPGGTTSLILDWDQQSGETLYDIAKSTGIDKATAVAALTWTTPFVTGQARNVVTRTDSGLSGTNYFCYQVKAYSTVTPVTPPAPGFSEIKCMQLPPPEPVISLSSTELESRYTVLEDASKNWNNGDVWMGQPVVITSGSTTYTKTVAGGTSASIFVSPAFTTETINAGDSYVVLHAVLDGRATGVGVDVNSPASSILDAGKNWNSIREWQGSKIKILNSFNTNNIGDERTLIGNWSQTVYADANFDTPIVAGDTYQIASFFGAANAAGTTTELTQTGAGWTVNAWAGYYLVMTSGPNNGHARKITSNSATILTTDAFPSAPVSGNTYLIAPVAKVGRFMSKAIAGSTATVVNMDAWWDTNFANYYLIMTSGNNAGRMRKITSSTVTSITVEPAFEVAVNSGDSFTVAPVAQINAYSAIAVGSSGYSKTELVDSINTWLTDWTQGYSLLMTSGNNNGQLRPIVGKVGATLTVSPEFANNISPADSYMIVQATAVSGSGMVSTPVAPGPVYNGKSKLSLGAGTVDLSATAPGYGNNYNYAMLNLKDLSPLAGDFDLKFDYSTPSLVADDASLAYKYLTSSYASARFDFQSPPGKTYQSYMYRGRMPRTEQGRAMTYTAATKTLTDTRTMPNSTTLWKNWTTDQWKDYYIQIVSGPNNQLVRKVTANTANSITLDNAFPFDPSGVSGNAAASGNSTTKLVDATGTTNWAANIWVNYLLYMDSGPNAGKSMRISSNDATSVTVEGTGFTSPIGSGDAYRISGDQYRINVIAGNAAINGSTKDGYNSTNSVLVDSSDNSSLTNIGNILPPKDWVTNQWAGFHLYLSSGPNIGQFRTIASNTANTITVTPPFPYQIASGDSYTIFDPRTEAQAIEMYWVQIYDPVASTTDFQIIPTSELAGKMRFAKTGSSLKFSTSPATLSWTQRRQLDLAAGNTFVPSSFWLYQLGRLPHTAGTSQSATINNFQFTVPASLPTTISSSYWEPEVGHFFRRPILSGTPVELSWTKVDSATLYQVERCESTTHQNPADRIVSTTCVTFNQSQPTDGGTRVASLAANAGLVAGYTYRFRVRTKYNDTDFTAWSSPLWLTITPPAPVMTAPAAATATTSQLTPTWTNVFGEIGYKLYWKTSSNSSCSDGTWSVTPLAQAKDLATFNHSSLTSGTIYCYYITAKGPLGPPVTADSIASNIVWQSTKPAAPGTITFSGITTASITLNWPQVTGNSAYQIDRSLDNVTWMNNVGTTGQNVNTFTNTGLSPGTRYYYRVSANSSGGFSAVSAVQSATTTPVSTTLALAVISAEQINLSWPVVFGATNYKLWRKEEANGSWGELPNQTVGYSQSYCGEPYPTVACPTPSASVVSYPDTGLKENTLYYYRVTAWNSTGGDSALSNEPYGTTSAMPKQNLTLTALPGGFRIKLDWTPIACTPFACDAPSGYEIQRQVKDGNWVLRKIINSGSTLTFTDCLAIDPGKQYRYRVRSLSGADKSPFSEAMIYAKPYSLVEATVCPE